MIYSKRKYLPILVSLFILSAIAFLVGLYLHSPKEADERVPSVVAVYLFQYAMRWAAIAGGIVVLVLRITGKISQQNTFYSFFAVLNLFMVIVYLVFFRPLTIGTIDMVELFTGLSFGTGMLADICLK